MGDNGWDDLQKLKMFLNTATVMSMITSDNG